jgi:putative Mn2+ efflux pump MntP
MGILEILIIGLGLSMDAFAVTIANAAAYAKTSLSAEKCAGKSWRVSVLAPVLLSMPLVFGLFQGLMPLAGYYAVTLFGDLLAAWEFTSVLDDFAGGGGEFILGLISGAILMVVGGRMTIGAIKALRKPQASLEEASVNLKFGTVVIQGVATSIDALLIGVSLAASGVEIWSAAGLIALTTLICCFLALALGRRFGLLLGEKAQVVGGLVLIAIAIKAAFF